MATGLAAPKQLAIADLKGKVDPDWCPGCGDFGVLAAVEKALVELQIPNHDVVTISGIGCSSNFPGFINTYGMHTLHGRALAVATGVKLANHDLTVLVTGGDGDGFGIGGNHFVHTMRRNVDLLYIVMDNQVYGLTTGQTSPTSRLGMKTKSMPFGNLEAPVNPISMALAAGATFIARGCRNLKTIQRTTPPTGLPRWKSHCCGVMRSRSENSSSAPTFRPCTVP